MNDKVVVLDMGIPAFAGNRILDPVFAAKYPGASIWPVFALMARAKGWQVMTSDVFLERGETPTTAMCISNEGNPRSVRDLIKRGVEMLVIVSGESPNVAWDFYHELGSRARHFQHAFVFRGFHDRLPEGIDAHVFHWPNPHRRIQGPPWHMRNVAAMVASAKKRIHVNRARLLSQAAWFFRWLKIRRLQYIDVKLRFPDLYAARIRLVEHLASQRGFRLFGSGWTLARGRRAPVDDSAFFVKPEVCEDKLTTISNFRFTLCMENCVFPGYVTEKIFDAMLAGTVPVYLGAPDVTDFVPPACFVDMRAFSGWDTLWHRLVAMRHDEWANYRGAIDHYLGSPEYRVFEQESFASSLVELVTRH